MSQGRKLAASRLTRHAARNFFGREPQLELLDRAWANPRTHVLSIVAWGGVGKTSLVTQWIATRMAAADWLGVERYFDWSFYSQGTGDSRQTSSDLFINDALRFFGDPDPVKGSPWERGERLAELVRQHRTLLVLDGIEPLQYPPTDRSGQAGRLKDQALEALLQSLVQEHNGLCILTTREHFTNIDSYPTQQEHKLDKLPLPAAIGLIRHLQLTGTDQEIEALWDALDGHALSLLQLGRLLARGYGHDLRKWREIGFTQADKLKHGRSTMKVMAQYEAWLAAGDKEQHLELAILRLMGLFEKPMSPGCFAALRAPPAIQNLTELFSGVEDFEIESAIRTLIDNELLSHSGGDGHSGLMLNASLDAHPLIREYFSEQLKRDQPEAFRAAHSRLFDYLCENTPYRPEGLDGLAPLYEAVVHGCLAGRHREAREKVYRDRITRGFYSKKKLGVIGADLAAVAAFFNTPWIKISPNLSASDQAWLLSEAAFCLRALGRLTEALNPMRAGLEILVQQQDWERAASFACNLSELEITMGCLANAVSNAHKSINYADRSGVVFPRMSNRTAKADALHQSGQRIAAGALFVEAEGMWKLEYLQPMSSISGSRYCDWLLAPAEQASWRKLLHPSLSPAESPYSDDLAEVEHRAHQAQTIAVENQLLLDIAHGHLILARVDLLRAILETDPPNLRAAKTQLHVFTTLNGLRAAGAAEFIVQGLITAALHGYLRSEWDLARNHLAEAQRIAERGPMPLCLADIHLHRARMFRDKAELAKAANLIRELGYGRRYQELEDAEAALATTSVTAPTSSTLREQTDMNKSMTPITGQESIIVLITVNDHETDALLDAFLGPRQAPVSTSRGGVTYHELGLHGGLRVIHSLCEMGAGGIGAAQQRAQDAISHWQPRAVIAVGIAFGIDEAKQQIGDVLVSVQLQDYELARVNADGTLTPRGDKSHAADTLINRFRQTDASGRRSASDWPKVRFGLVLSGQKLIDSLDYRENLKHQWTEAIGGEMEGTGLYTSAQRAGVDWLVVKAICDWGHQKNQADKDAWQKTAASNAVRVVKAALDADDLYPPSAESAPDVRPSASSASHPNSDHRQPATTAWEHVDLLETLKQLPEPWFEELLFKFDRHNSVPSRVAQSVRAIEFLKVLRMTESGLQEAAAEIERLKARSR